MAALVPRAARPDMGMRSLDGLRSGHEALVGIDELQHHTLRILAQCQKASVEFSEVRRARNDLSPVIAESDPFSAVLRQLGRRKCRAVLSELSGIHVHTPMTTSIVPVAVRRTQFRRRA